jgi:hypothetical protein
MYLSPGTMNASGKKGDKISFPYFNLFNTPFRFTIFL